MMVYFTGEETILPLPPPKAKQETKTKAGSEQQCF